MRYDNYFLALVSHGVLTRAFPCWFPVRLLFTSYVRRGFRSAVALLLCVSVRYVFMLESLLGYKSLSVLELTFHVILPLIHSAALPKLSFVRLAHCVSAIFLK